MIDEIFLNEKLENGDELADKIVSLLNSQGNTVMEQLFALGNTITVVACNALEQDKSFEKLIEMVMVSTSEAIVANAKRIKEEKEAAK